MKVVQNVPVNQKMTDRTEFANENNKNRDNNKDEEKDNFHALKLFDNNGCHLCPKQCSRCTKQAVYHALSMGTVLNFCIDHKPQYGEKWNNQSILMLQQCQKI